MIAIALHVGVVMPLSLERQRQALHRQLDVVAAHGGQLRLHHHVAVRILINVNRGHPALRHRETLALAEDAVEHPLQPIDFHTREITHGIPTNQSHGLKPP